MSLVTFYFGSSIPDEIRWEHRIRYGKYFHRFVDPARSHDFKFFQVNPEKCSVEFLLQDKRFLRFARDSLLHVVMQKPIFIVVSYYNDPNLMSLVRFSKEHGDRVLIDQLQVFGGLTYAIQ